MNKFRINSAHNATETIESKSLSGAKRKATVLFGRDTIIQIWNESETERLAISLASGWLDNPERYKSLIQNQKYFGTRQAELNEKARINKINKLYGYPKNLICCCCVGHAYGRQHWNRDTGYGLCDDCIDFCGRTSTKEDFKSIYGIKGVHYGVRI